MDYIYVDESGDLGSDSNYLIMAVIIVAYIVGSIAYKKITDAHKKNENIDSIDEKQENDG